MQTLVFIFDLGKKVVLVVISNKYTIYNITISSSCTSVEVAALFACHLNGAPRH